MPKAAHQFTHSHTVLEDGAVAFRCSGDREQWPWLALDPADPIAVQNMNYYASIEAAWARGSIDPQTWTALTQTKWTCGEDGVGQTTHGIAEASKGDGKPGYAITFFDDAGALVCRMSGEGVVFQNRDFEGWRQDAKRKVEAPVQGAFRYAPAEAVGVKEQGWSFLSPLIENETAAMGLITKENGLPPGHPYLSGSGDHVNATHLAEAARQFACIRDGGRRRRCTGGAMQFRHFVELGTPFRVALAEETASGDATAVTIHQADRLCASVELCLD